MKKFIVPLVFPAFICMAILLLHPIRNQTAMAQQGEGDMPVEEEHEYTWEPVLREKALPLGKAATSWLRDKKDPDMYSPPKAFDGNPKTAWVEGVDGDGIGQKLGFFAAETIHSIKILPGIGDAKYFKKNNRVKKAKLSIYEAKGSGITEYDLIYEFETLVKTVPLEFKDSMNMQEFEVGISQKRDLGYVGIIEIVEVYRGTAWRDTGIAEVEIVK